jgi:acetate---CoA ligase (ADP-forming)
MGTQSEGVGPAAATRLAFRGQPPAAEESPDWRLGTLADYARADRAVVAELDVNPITVVPRGKGCVAVDALIVPRASRGARP